MPSDHDRTVKDERIDFTWLAESVAMVDDDLAKDLYYMCARYVLDKDPKHGRVYRLGKLAHALRPYIDQLQAATLR